MLYLYVLLCIKREKIRQTAEKDLKKTNEAHIFNTFKRICSDVCGKKTQDVLIAYVMQAALLCCILVIYKYIYKRASWLVVNNMCMLLAIGLMILFRLNQEKALRQYEIAVAAVVITLIVPFVIHKLHFLYRLAWLYAVAGIALLAAVAVLGSVSYGAKLSFRVAGIAIQPSEFVKILFVFLRRRCWQNLRNLRRLQKRPPLRRYMS